VNMAGVASGGGGALGWLMQPVASERHDSRSIDRLTENFGSDINVPRDRRACYLAGRAIAASRNR